MNAEVTDFDVVSTSSPEGVRVYGDPYHETATDLVRQYRDGSRAEFLASEARRSCGNYVLIAGDERCIDVVTAPGYCGGYVYETRDRIQMATTLADLLEDVPVADLAIDEDFVRHYLNHAETPLHSKLPLSGLFESVTRFPPATFLRVVDGDVEEFWSYLTVDRPRPQSFGAALEETTSNLRGLDVGVMYSGGVDSSALYLALTHHIPEDSIELTTVDIGPNMNSVARAETAAENLGAEFRPIDHSRPVEDDDLLDYVESQMRQDFVNPLEPEFAYAATDVAYDLIVGAEMTDVLLTGDMHRPQTTQLQHLLSTRDVLEFVSETARNVQFTEPYVNHYLSRWLYTVVVPRLFGKEQVVDPSFDGYLDGLLSSLPNFVHADDYPHVARERERLRDYVGPGDNGTVADAFQFAIQVNNVLKRACTFPKGDARFTLVPPWGPVSSYCIGRGRALTDAVAVKREVYQYVEDRAGQSYFEFALTDPAELRAMQEREQQFKSGLHSKLLERNREYFEGDSILPSLVSDDDLRASVRRAHSRVADDIDAGMSYGELTFADQLLNLEILLEELADGPVDQR